MRHARSLVLSGTILLCLPVSITAAPRLSSSEVADPQGSAAAQYALGVMCANGEGVPQDFVKAAEWFKKSADQGYAKGQTALASLYANGQGVPRDAAQAAFWYGKAAEQGDVEAQLNIGFMTDMGLGVAQDSVRAAFWYQKAAEQGSLGAQYNLGVMYEDGQGVPKDLVQAHKWASIATALATNEADRSAAASQLERVAAQMTPAQIAEAQKVERAWREEVEQRKK